MSNYFLVAAEKQFNTNIIGSRTMFSCHTIGHYSIENRRFYEKLYDIEPTTTFHSRLAKLQKKSCVKTSRKRLNEVRVLALLFAYHIYNDSEGC